MLPQPTKNVLKKPAVVAHVLKRPAAVANAAATEVLKRPAIANVRKRPKKKL